MFDLNSPRGLVSGALEVLGVATKVGGASRVDEDGPVMQILKKENIISTDNHSRTQCVHA